MTRTKIDKEPEAETVEPEARDPEPAPEPEARPPERPEAEAPAPAEASEAAAPEPPEHSEAQEPGSEVSAPESSKEPRPQASESSEAESSEEHETGATPGAAEETASDAPDEPASRRLLKDPLVRVALAITLIAALAAAWFGWSYNSASDDGSLTYAAERDRALAAADQAIVNLNTLDYRNLDAGLKVWQDSATAQLYDEIVKGRDRLRQDVEKGKTTSTAKVLESGLTELDVHAGKAAVVAAVRITITGADGKPANNTRRFAGQLTKTSSGWKLSALGQAPTGTS
ncbi:MULTISPECIES: hypothetical protein [Actinomadura]|uniref:Mce-associated membrane protein n=1 Tax=Actinomadura yumaensis TaxID=111807 RepID=A0ABW2CPX3_9ACTN|nr:hypothetical protein [Actinomadura sp. J1-007]